MLAALGASRLPAKRWPLSSRLAGWCPHLPEAWLSPRAAPAPAGCRGSCWPCPSVTCPPLLPPAGLPRCSALGHPETQAQGLAGSRGRPGPAGGSPRPGCWVRCRPRAGPDSGAAAPFSPRRLWPLLLKEVAGHRPIRVQRGHCSLGSGRLGQAKAKARARVSVVGPGTPDSMLLPAGPPASPARGACTRSGTLPWPGPSPGPPQHRCADLESPGPRGSPVWAVAGVLRGGPASAHLGQLGSRLGSHVGTPQDCTRTQRLPGTALRGWRGMCPQPPREPGRSGRDAPVSAVTAALVTQR